MEPVTYVIVFDVVPERRAEFLALLGDVLDSMRHEANFREAVLHRDPQHENRFLLYETWASHQDVLDVQIKRAYRQKWHEALPRLLHGERQISIWQPLRSDRAPRSSEAV